jgi:integrase
MVLLIGSTGVRRSELMALVWTDINLETMEVSITKSCVRNRLGDTKTECSRRPVPLHPLVLESLLDWKRQSPYQSDGDFLFPSIRLNGTKPLSPDSLLKKSIRPALIRRYRRKSHRLAQLSPYPRNAASSNRNGYQSGAGFAAACEQSYHARYLHPLRLAAKARRQH